MNRGKYKDPNAILYFIVYILIYPFLKIFFRLKVDRSNYNPPDGPFIVVCNHESFMDFLLAMLAVYPHRLNAITAQKFFLYKPLDKLLPIMGCIPKNLFDPDPRSIIGIMSVIKYGGRLLLFPEGRCSTGGAYMGMHKSTGKLIKKLNVPVVSCHIEGASVCMPLWRKGLRFGRLRVTLAGLFDPDELQAISVDEINRRIDDRLSGADIAVPAKPFKLFLERKLTDGLENILYLCPKCRREFTLETSGNRIFCTACGNSAIMDRSSLLTPEQESIIPESVQHWHRDQVIYESHLFREGMDPIIVQVTVRMPSIAGNGLVQCGRGVLQLNSEGWLYHGEISGEDVELFFPIDTVPAIPFDPNDNFQIYAGGKFYVFTPADNPRSCARFAILGECAYRRFASAVKMTSGCGTGFDHIFN